MPRYLVTIEGQEYDIMIESQHGSLFGTVNGERKEIVAHKLPTPNGLLVTIDHKPVEGYIQYSLRDNERLIQLDGAELTAHIQSYAVAKMLNSNNGNIGHTSERLVKSPMPGLVVQIRVSKGERVRKGQPLIAIEAMKMENVIKSKSDGVVSAIHASVGGSVEKGDTLLEFAS